MTRPHFPGDKPPEPCSSIIGLIHSLAPDMVLAHPRSELTFFFTEYRIDSRARPGKQDMLSDRVFSQGFSFSTGTLSSGRLFPPCVSTPASSPTPPNTSASYPGNKGDCLRYAGSSRVLYDPRVFWRGEGVHHGGSVPLT